MTAVHYVAPGQLRTLCGIGAGPVAWFSSPAQIPLVSCPECQAVIVSGQLVTSVTNPNATPSTEELRRRWAIEQATRIFQGSGQTLIEENLKHIADAFLAYILRSPE
jgi:hypothetical protein